MPILEGARNPWCEAFHMHEIFAGFARRGKFCAGETAWLPRFITANNTRFGRDPANAKDLHRPLARTDDLDEILAWREERTVTRNPGLRRGRLVWDFGLSRAASVSTITAWQVDRLQLLEVEFDDGL